MPVRLAGSRPGGPAGNPGIQTRHGVCTGERARTAAMRGSWRMTEPPEVFTELANLCVPTAGCERPLK